ncbi:MAG: hypothetical protein COA63_003790 [Methylophaga sp.]|nr:hypothetical protein [Methylophaga sp.]
MNISAVAAPLTSIPTKRTTVVSEQEAATNQLSEQDLQQIKQLKTRDSIVRAHEMAHITAGHGITQGSANFSFQRGPNGIQYAIGGEVQIDTSKITGDPVATLKKAVQIQTAALAPLQPSSQDRTIAANAAQMAIEARSEIKQQPTESESPDDFSSAEKTVGELLDFKV